MKLFCSSIANFREIFWKNFNIPTLLEVTKRILNVRFNFVTSGHASSRLTVILSDKKDKTSGLGI